MTQEEKFKRAIRLGDAMYYAAQMLSTDASHLKKAMEDWWQFENVELKESEDENVREYLIRYIDNTMKSSELKSKLLNWLEKQKPAWSEGDETLLSSIINSLLIFEDSGASKMKIDWLISIKQRIGR